MRGRRRKARRMAVRQKAVQKETGISWSEIGREITAFHVMLGNINMKILSKWGRDPKKLLKKKPIILYKILDKKVNKKIYLQQPEIVIMPNPAKYLLKTLKESLKPSNSIVPEHNIFFIQTGFKFHYLFTTYPVSNIDTFIENTGDISYQKFIASALSYSRYFEKRLVFYYEYTNEEMNKTIYRLGANYGHPYVDVRHLVEDDGRFPTKTIYALLYMLSPKIPDNIFEVIYGIVKYLGKDDETLSVAKSVGLVEKETEKELEEDKPGITKEGYKKLLESLNKRFQEGVFNRIIIHDFTYYPVLSNEQILPRMPEILTGSKDILEPFSIVYLDVLRERKTTKVLGAINLGRLGYFE